MSPRQEHGIDDRDTLTILIVITMQDEDKVSPIPPLTRLEILLQ